MKLHAKILMVGFTVAAHAAEQEPKDPGLRIMITRPSGTEYIPSPTELTAASPSPRIRRNSFPVLETEEEGHKIRKAFDDYDEVRPNRSPEGFCTRQVRCLTLSVFTCSSAIIMFALFAKGNGINNDQGFNNTFHGL